MKRFLIHTVRFLVILSALWFVGVGLVGALFPLALRKNVPYYVTEAYGHTFSRLKEVENYGDVDALVLGSSHAYRGFDPRIFEEEGLRIFNLGSSAQSPMLSEYLFDQYVEELQPEWLILEVYPFTMASDGVEAALDILPKTSFKVSKMELALRLNELRVYNVVLFNLWNEWITMYDYDALSEPIRREEDMYVQGGYVEIDTQDEHAGKKAKQEELVIDSQQWKALKRILEKAKSRGIRVIFVQAPVSKSYANRITNSYEIDASLEMLRPDLYLNYNEASRASYPDALFYDADHLKQTGVDRFNRQFIADWKAALDVEQPFKSVR